MLTVNPDSHGNGDLVAHFFRRAFELARQQGTVGLIGTNTISQGDTRTTGLRWICVNGGEIYQARRRVKWPGDAAVIVCVIHIVKGARLSARSILDGHPTNQITSFLFHTGGHENPKTLIANDGKSFLGVALQGYGFVFDGDGSSAQASSIDTMNRLLEADARNNEVIFPYIGGEEVNSSPSQDYERFVINFGNRTEEEARAWPSVMEIVEANVKPGRLSNNRETYRRYWWQHGEKRQELWDAIEGMKRVLVTARVSQHSAFVFLNNDIVYSEQLVCFPFEDFAALGLLQSRLHEMWARFFSSSLEDRLRYSPTDCFGTFPFPNDLSGVHDTSEEYYQIRQRIMAENSEGLTKTYNRFHDPHEQSEGILELRRLHGLMDGAVLRAYGWDDLAESARCEFLLDYEEEEDDADAGPPAAGARKKSKKKKPWRYRWPDEFRDEVLARLLELNEQRHREELLVVSSQLLEKKQEKAKETATKKREAKPTPLFDELDRDERTVVLLVQHFNLITRDGLDEGFIAMRYPKLRKAKLGLGDPPKTVPSADPGRDAVIGGLVDKGFLAKHPSEHQQIWTLGETPPPLGTISKKETEALEETRLIFQQAIDADNGMATCNEGVTDAKPGLVSSA